MRHKFHVSGMHCASCAMVIEDELCRCGGVRSAKVSLAARTLEIEGDFDTSDLREVAASLTAPIEGRGYRVLVDAPVSSAAKWGEFKIAAPVALAILGAFVGLQKLGLVNLIGAGDLSYGGVFAIGVIASLSSCLAVVGGIALSMSASYAKAGAKVWPQVAFHASRLVAFFLLGGLMGWLGAEIAPGPTGSAVLSLLVGIAMIALGINLLDVFPWAKRLQLSAPKVLSRGALKLGGSAGWLAPVALGAATFVLPCGFTQSMQLFALSRGTFVEGAFTMLVFALGTLPVLAAVSFGPGVGTMKTGVFFKVAGLLAIAFAAINLLGALAAFGLIKPVLNF